MEPADYKPKRFFTVEEANKMLPLVKRIVADIQRAYAEFADRQLVYSAATRSDSQGERSDEVAALEDELERRKDELVAYIHELSELGIELKAPSAGLIDFPAMREGRIVYLCWKLGEPRVEYWHELEAGYRGRQPLEGQTIDSAAGQ